MRDNGDIFSNDGWLEEWVVPSNTGTLLKWGLVLILGIALLVGLNGAWSIYTDLLWFDHLGFLDVFTTILLTRIWLFLIGAVISGLLIIGSITLAQRYSVGQPSLRLHPQTLLWLKRLVSVAPILVGVLVTIIFASVASSQWEPILKFINKTPFGGDVDPVFQKDISFFVFTLPVLHFMQSWFLGIFIALLAGTGATYLASYAIGGARIAFTPRIRNHIAILGALLFINLSANHFLDRYELLLSANGAVFGATYTDIHARMFALALLTVVAGVSSILLIASIAPVMSGHKGTRLIMGAVALWAVAAIAAGIIYPSFVQRFTVDPNEITRETPYIQRNISFTRTAFGLNKIEERAFPMQKAISSATFIKNPATISNVRLWDPRPLRDTYNQIQFLRLYYNFVDVDVDRYVIDDEYRQVLIGARELQVGNLPQEAQRWINQRLQYTHGYGAAASPVTEFTAGGEPVFFAKDIPPVGPISIDQPEIYYGESGLNFVIVNSETPELDYEPNEGNPIYNNYSGNGGVLMNSFLRRVAYAWEFGDVNILVSNQIEPESRIQYRRTIKKRISHVAPFLELDKDPYLVVEDGKMRWVQDAYTVSSHYPYSTPFQGSSNYIRNSVKVVVDAYHGTMEFYVSDPYDPIILTYEKIFPVLFKPLGSMSEFLQTHLRYPEDLFSIQAEMYLQYHMQDTNQFFNKADQWDIPLEEFFGDTRSVAPYYVVMKLPGEDQPEFVLILPFTPWPTDQKPKMVAWMAARMDQPHYGELIA
ncbi:UPF0182 family protein, partial [Dehalococcoidia bacterium]|nr:UPF0182 family protein [Dehalococcoidia bacterium]